METEGVLIEFMYFHLGNLGYLCHSIAYRVCVINYNSSTVFIGYDRNFVRTVLAQMCRKSSDGGTINSSWSQISVLNLPFQSVTMYTKERIATILWRTATELLGLENLITTRWALRTNFCSCMWTNLRLCASYM